MATDTYNTIESISEGIYREKGSKFISIACPVSSVDEVKEIIDRVRKEYHDARHHCFAYMLGPEREKWRVNDDGEPSGTAGKPILGQINSHELTDILIVVTRYFGGTLLGVSGLINAYRSAAAEAIGNAKTITCHVMIRARLDYPYEAINDVMKIIKEHKVSVTDQTIDSECSATIAFPRSMSDAVIGRIEKIPGIKLSLISPASD